MNNVPACFKQNGSKKALNVSQTRGNLRALYAFEYVGEVAEWKRDKMETNTTCRTLSFPPFFKLSFKLKMNAVSFLLPDKILIFPTPAAMAWPLSMLLCCAALFIRAFKNVSLCGGRKTYLVFLPTFWMLGLIWCPKIEKEGEISDYSNRMLFHMNYFILKHYSYHFIRLTVFSCQGKWWADFHVLMNI